jgi:large repetitive protein
MRDLSLRTWLARLLLCGLVACAGADVDGDGYAEAEDCDPQDSAVHPGAAEACNGADDDCDGQIDEGLDGLGTWFIDADGDSFGDDASVVSACTMPYGSSSVGGDCDDDDDTRYPGAPERCDEVDQDCDGSTDEDAIDTQSWWRDLDGDGAGGTGSAESGCDPPADAVDNELDCDDTDADISPWAVEVCNEVDDDCDDLVDDLDDDVVDVPTWYPDEDGDGYGGDAVQACVAPPGSVELRYDCDDTDPAVHPGAVEVCNEQDDDCDELVDTNDVDLDLSTIYQTYDDHDGDGYGNDASRVDRCFIPTGMVTVGGDCDDHESAVHPGADDSCTDSTDSDCDATTCPS